VRRWKWWRLDSRYLRVEEEVEFGDYNLTRAVFVFERVETDPVNSGKRQQMVMKKASGSSSPRKRSSGTNETQTAGGPNSRQSTIDDRWMSHDTISAVSVLSRPGLLCPSCVDMRGNSNLVKVACRNAVQALVNARLLSLGCGQGSRRMRNRPSATRSWGASRQRGLKD